MHKQLFISLIFSVIVSQSLSAQSVQIIGGNTLNGALNGLALGGAVMALTDDADLAPLRVGLGTGTLYGIGMGVYDVSYSKGNQLLVSGFFNDGNNSSIIILLDTVYGAGAGAIVVTAVMLVANEPLVDGIQYGAGIGAWAGFGFGLVDSFLLSKRTTAPRTASVFDPGQAPGLLTAQFQNHSVGFVNPSMMRTIEATNSTLSARIVPTVDLVNLKLNF
ncbi:MAG: hypothetical protein AAFW89_14005 [Bacteroidota bacterium]